MTERQLDRLYESAAPPQRAAYDAAIRAAQAALAKAEKAAEKLLTNA